MPFVALLVALTAAIAVPWYRASRAGADAIAQRWAMDTVSRVAAAVHGHISRSEAVLEAAHPAGLAAPHDLRAAVPMMRVRMWGATTPNLEVSNYVYFGNGRGQFVGLWRHSATEAELRTKFEHEDPRQIAQFTGVAGELQAVQVESRVFKPQDRPWYRAATHGTGDVWTPVYVDFLRDELVMTRARQVAATDPLNDPHAAGVVAADVSLHALGAFARSLVVSTNGFALVVEGDGSLVAASNMPSLVRGGSGQWQRARAQDAPDARVRQAYDALLRLPRMERTTSRTQAAHFTAEDGQVHAVGMQRVSDVGGLDWWVLAVAPRHDFMAEVEANIRNTGMAARVAVALRLALGSWVLRRLSQDVAQLSQVAQRIGGGDLNTPMAPLRTPDLMGLAQALEQMQTRLRTDRLTGLANRDALVQRLEERLLAHRRQADARPLAVLFIDLDGFKLINDAHGHDVGDQVLEAVGTRLRHTLREGDMVARWSGDEFVALLELIPDEAAALAAAAHLQHALDEPLRLPGSDHTLMAQGTVGVAFTAGTSGTDPQSLIRQADLDMYLRKAQRRSPAPAPR